MTTEDLKKILSAVNDAKAVAQQQRNEEDRKVILAGLSADFIRLFTPLLKQQAENARINKEEMIEMIKQITIAPPTVNVKTDTPKAEVKIENKPVVVDTKNIEKVLAKALAAIKMPESNVNYQPPDIILPKQFEIKGMAELGNKIDRLANKKIEAAKPVALQKVVLKNPDGSKFNFPMMAGGGQGGGSGGGSKVFMEEYPMGFEQLVINDTAGGFASLPDGANKAILTVDDSNIRYRDDGNDPTASVGVLAYRLATIVLHSRKALEQFSAIRKGSSNASLDILYYEVK